MPSRNQEVQASSQVTRLFTPQTAFLCCLRCPHMLSGLRCQLTAIAHGEGKREAEHFVVASPTCGSPPGLPKQVPHARGLEQKLKSLRSGR